MAKAMGKKAAFTDDSAVSTTLGQHEGPVTCIHIHRNSLIAGGSRGHLKFRMLNSFDTSRLLVVDGFTTVSHIAISNDGNTISCSGESPVIKVSRMTDGSTISSLVGHTNNVTCIRPCINNSRLISSSLDGSLRFWSLGNFKCIDTIAVQESLGFTGLMVSKDESKFATASRDGVIRIWDLRKPKITHIINEHDSAIVSLDCDPDMHIICTGDERGNIVVWENGKALCRIKSGSHPVKSICLLKTKRQVLSGSADNAIRVWDIDNATLVATLEGHTGSVTNIINYNEKMCITGSFDGTIRLWDMDSLIKRSYTNAKVLIVGDTGVGKSGLAHRITKGEFISTISTDGAWATQLQIPLSSSSKKQEREIWLWDFAGQYDYMFNHQLYMDETVLVVFVFNPQDNNPFDKLTEWVRAISQASNKPYLKFLVAGRCDRGGLRMSRDTINDFCEEHGFVKYLETSANTGAGCDELKDDIIEHIPWNILPWTSSPKLFRRLKSRIIQIKDASYSDPETAPALLQFKELRERISGLDNTLVYTDEELQAVVALLHSPGVVWRLGFGDMILLQPERINAYAFAVIQKVRQNIDELGIINENDLISGKLVYRDIARLPFEQEQVVLRSINQLFVSRCLCIREDVRKGTVLIFPSLFRRRRPTKNNITPSFVSYMIKGYIDEIYASLIVVLSNIDFMVRKAFWNDAADFITPTGNPITVRLSKTEPGAAEITMHVAFDIADDFKVLLEKCVYTHLRTKSPEIKRRRNYICQNAKCKRPFLDVNAVDDATKFNKPHLHCALCGKKIMIKDKLEELFESDNTQHEAVKYNAQAQYKLDNESKELMLKGHVFVLAGTAGQIYREYTNSDHGIDGEIEFKDIHGKATGKKLYLQLKHGDTYTRTRKDGKEFFVIKKSRWIKYWHDHNYPVMLVVMQGDGMIRWMNITDYINAFQLMQSSAPQIEFIGEEFTPDNIINSRNYYLGYTKEAVAIAKEWEVDHSTRKKSRRKRK